MAIGSVLKTVRDNLHTQLSARSGLSGVSINKYNPIESNKKEFIFFGDSDSTINFQAFGSVYEEDLSLEIFVYVLRAGAGDSVAGTTESRAIALANEIVDQLNDDSTINGAVIVASINSINVENTLTDEGRVCVVQLNLDAEATLSE
tara:strand:+ start:4677 stop:5117 length:441 start_codon:yes stop_codon:yes gene_type:complete